jgi:peptidoglycan/LPS O-acetylase OafA/YrhL
MNYRPEIDGLRAIAVIPVILFHAGFGLFGGGYVGVDVFFVISGYLITSIILAEREAGAFSLVNFYERRARRILPALFVVMAACVPFAWIWMTPSDMKDFSRSLAYMSVFASNILFYKQSGYFDAASELKPLLHTWSLAVEEQYYLLFPLLLVAALRRGKRFAILLLAVVAIVSLTIAQWGATRVPAATFYLLHTRLWELLVGGFVAFHLRTQGEVAPPAAGDTRKVSEALGIAGIALIGYSVGRYDRNTPYPSLYALVPTMGAVLVIVYSSARTLVGRVLGSKALVGIGLVSYSAYLWHQPLFAFARQRSITEPSAIILLALAVVTFGFAFFSWRFVELPFRRRGRVATKTVFRAGAIGTAMFLGLAALGVQTSGFKSRLPGEMYSLVEPRKTNEKSACKRSQKQKIGSGLKICEFGQLDSPRTLVLYGDSHAQALFTELDGALRKRNIRGVRIYNSACEVIPGLLSTLRQLNSAECERAHRALLQYVKDHADYVVVAIRWTYKLYPVPGAVDELAFDNQEGGRELGAPPRRSYTEKYGARGVSAAGKVDALNEFLGEMAAASKRLILIYPIPEVGWDIPKYNFKRYLDGRVDPEITTAFEVFKRRNAFAEGVLNAFGSRDNLTRVRPEEIFCNTYVQGRCVAQVNAIPLYYDDDHLSNAGSAMVVEEIMASLSQEEPPAGGSQ